MVIWRYALSVAHETIRMPAGAKILDVQVKDGTTNMWVLVDPRAPEERRRFVIIASGEEFDPEASLLSYIGTVQMPNTVIGTLVWHLWEIGEGD